MTRTAAGRWAGLVTAVGLALGALASAGPARAEPGQAAVSAAAAELDPSPLEPLFARHVRGGAVDYRGLKGDATARAGLARFLDAAASMSERAPLASWLNVYNALVIEAVLERYPLDSVQSVPDFFQRKWRTIAGEPRSLDGIEHGLVRPRFQDARVHVALNCAAASCPPLPRRPFRQAGLDARLDALARAAVHDPRVVRLEGGVLHVSRLFEWFREDFVRDAGSVQAWIAGHAKGPPLSEVKASTPLKTMEYDWSLAEVK